MGCWFEALGAFGSSGVLCDQYVLETVKAEDDGLNTEYRLGSLAWAFDEKNEFCARTGFNLEPRTIMIFNSSQVEPLDFGPF